MKVLIVDGEFHWGFSVRAPYTSAGSQSYPLPPPTTLVGALARAYAKLLSKGEVTIINQDLYSTTIELLDYVVWASIKLYRNNYMMPYSDMIRLLRVQYVREPYRIEPTKWFGVSAFGKVYGNTKFRIVYILLEDLIEKLGRDIIVRMGLGIVSLGSKESIVSISNVKLVDPVKVKLSSFETPYYVPRTVVDEFDEVTAKVVSMPKYPPRKSYYLLREYIGLEEIHEDYLIPRGPANLIQGSNMKILKITNRAKVLRVENDFLLLPLRSMRSR